MTEIYKSDKLYDANNDPKLIELRLKCKDLCHKFNQTLPSNIGNQRKVITSILADIGVNFVITAPFWCDYGTNIFIGHNFYCNHNLTILDGAKVTIGDNVYIGPNCCISTSSHPIDFETRNQGLEYAKPVEIGDNVWIGANVTILAEVKIGEGSVIGAGSVVTRDIGKNKIAFGNPCKEQREV